MRGELGEKQLDFLIAHRRRDETCWFFGLTATGLSVVTQALKQKSDEAM